MSESESDDEQRGLGYNAQDIRSIITEAAERGIADEHLARALGVTTTEVRRMRASQQRESGN